MRKYVYIIIFIMIIGIVNAINTVIPPRDITPQTSGSLFNPTNNITNYVIINVTNNITQYVTNNITNNITNDIIIENNITNNITHIINITQNITNYVDNVIINNITNNLTYFITETYNITFYANNTVNVSLNVFNITNNYTETYNDTALILLISQLNGSIYNINSTIHYYNDTAYCDAMIESLNQSIIRCSAYGELSYYGGTDTLTLSLQNVYYNITNYNVSGLLKNFYLNGNSLVCNNSGIYLIGYSNYYSLSSSNNLEFGVFINNTLIGEGIIGKTALSGSRDNINNNFIYQLNVGDKINLRVRNTDSSGKILTFYAKNMYLYKIGD